MKKQLLFVLNVCLCIGLTAQTQVKAKKQNTGNNQQNQNDNASSSFYSPATKIMKPVATPGNRAVTKTKFTSSYNALTLLVTSSNCLTANQATNMVMFTHRISKDWKPANVNSGFIQSTFTTNYGSTWDSLLHLQQVAPNLCRYPSGAIFNPSGNTTPGNAFGVVTGPITNGAAPGWKGNYFASTQMNKTNNDVKIRLNATTGVKKQHFARISLQSTDNKVIVTGGLYGGEPDATTLALQAYRGAMINIGTKSGNAFVWAVDSIKPSFKKPSAGQNYVFSQALTAWSKDGSIGYVVFSGVDAAATGSKLAYQPIVYKTTNGGSSWTKMPSFDYSAIPSINAKLRASDNGGAATGPKKAWYTQGSGMDAVVDANNNLHIICEIASGYSVHADSLDYTRNSIAGVGYLYDTYSTSTGWDALLIDSLKCNEANTNSPFADAAGVKYVIDARLQASISTDATHIFYTWLDSDPGLLDPQNPENIQPDIYCRGWDISAGKSTPSTRFTFDEFNYWLFASNIALVNGTTYSIPATVSQSRDGLGIADSTFDHYFVNGIQFMDSEFTITTPISGTVGVENISQNENSIISQNYPNPFSKSTSIDVTLKEADMILIEVYNTIGQKVITQNSEKLNIGTHTLTIDGSKLPPGVYFYTVKVADTSITRKMIVQ